MLTLGFREGEVAVVGLSITALIYRRAGSRRKFVINAPAEITVLRTEVHNEDQAEDETPWQDEIPLKDYGNLVLTREVGQSIDFLCAGQFLGRIHLVQNRASVRLAFEFPHETEVLRGSVFVRGYRTSDPKIFDNPTLVSLLSKEI